MSWLDTIELPDVYIGTKRTWLAKTDSLQMHMMNPRSVRAVGSSILSPTLCLVKVTKESYTDLKWALTSVFTTLES